MHTKPFAILAALALTGCGSSNSNIAHDPLEDGAVRDGAQGHNLDASPVNESESSSPAVDAGPIADAAPDADAGVICSPLGTACTTSATCLCGLGGGCNWDNVTCRNGVCALDYGCNEAGVCDGSAGPLLPPLDAGNACCSACEYNYDVGKSTLVEWRTCAASCGSSACAIGCLAGDRP